MSNLINKFIGQVIPTSIEVLGGVFDKIFNSDEEKSKVQAVLEKLKQHPGALQTALNKIEAKHKSLLVSGWRPFIGWLYRITGPFFPLEVMMELVTTMLGFGTLRTVEKFLGKAK